MFYNKTLNELIINTEYSVQVNGYPGSVLYFPGYTLDEFKRWGEDYLDK